MSKTALVIFTPSGKRGEFPLGTPILKCARSLGVDIDSVCGGRGICGRCQVTQGIGEFAKLGITSIAKNISPPNSVEKRYEKKRGLKTDRRLSCNTLLMGDSLIDVPPESQVHKQIVRKRAEVRGIDLNPAIRLYYVEVEEPDMHNPTGDLERLFWALRDQWDLKGIKDCDLNVIHNLQKTLRNGKWKVTVAIIDSERVIAIWPDFHDKIYGIAFDVGSTTIAAHLCELSSGDIVASSGIMNPQIRFGEDLMSRVSYVMMNPGGNIEMTDAVRASINGLINELTSSIGLTPEAVLSATFVGNPVMHHLLLGIDPTELGGAPFALAKNSSTMLQANELDLKMHPNARAYVLPCIAGHVGADTAAVILSESPQLSDDLVLIVDVGTNAEIVLGNKNGLLAASSPTGPAFEGAQISSGQRAAPGAIERVRIDPNTLEPTFSIIGCELWSNHPDFAKSAQVTGVTGICGSGIIEVIAEMFLAGIVTKDGVIDGNMAKKSGRIQADGRTFSYIMYDGDVKVCITQNDIRAIQLAKAALYAGARLLMDKLKIETVDRIILAGAFGSHIDTKYAMVLGMIPDCPLDKVSSAGNAAGTGACIALLNQKARSEIERIVSDVEKIETAVEAKFQDHFVEAMAFPHKTANYNHLATSVNLPISKTPLEEHNDSGRDGKGRRQRRRRRSD